VFSGGIGWLRSKARAAAVGGSRSIAENQ
jgi:hypothetical protein